METAALAEPHAPRTHSPSGWLGPSVGSGDTAGLCHGRCPQTCSPTQGTRTYSDPQGLWVEGDPRAKQPPWGVQPQRALRPPAMYTECLQALGSIRTQNSPHSPVHLGDNLKRFRNFSRKTRCLYLTLKRHHPIIS